MGDQKAECWPPECVREPAGGCQRQMIYSALNLILIDHSRILFCPNAGNARVCTASVKRSSLAVISDGRRKSSGNILCIGECAAYRRQSKLTVQIGLRTLTSSNPKMLIRVSMQRLVAGCFKQTAEDKTDFEAMRFGENKSNELSLIRARSIHR